MNLQEVSLGDMLDAREARAVRQKELLSEFQSTLVSFSMNIAGPIKNSGLILKGYLKGLDLLSMQLENEGFRILHMEERRAFTGNEALLAVDAPAREVKRLTCQIEETDVLGRLFDMDVLTPEGRKLERSELGLSPRKCLICNGPAVECASRRKHTLQELQSHTEKILREYFQDAFADAVSAMAVQSLLYEVSVTPKPGLVDRDNCGSHADMDFFTFSRSAAALAPWFRKLTLQGIRSCAGSSETAFQALNYVGRQAERAMFRATGGVNTHKGAIFSLGLLCGAAGTVFGSGRPVSTERVLRQCAALARSSSRREQSQTAGNRAFRTHGVAGIRGEAAAGFPTVQTVGMPILRSLLAEGRGPDEAGGITLLHLISEAEDTCLISRAGYEQWKRLQKRLRETLLEEPRPDLELRKALDEEFIQNNWSAGGCADLLAVCWMLLMLEAYTAEEKRVVPETV